MALHKFVYWSELVSQVSDVAHGPFVIGQEHTHHTSLVWNFIQRAVNVKFMCTFSWKFHVKCCFLVNYDTYRLWFFLVYDNFWMAILYKLAVKVIWIMLFTVDNIFWFMDLSFLEGDTKSSRVWWLWHLVLWSGKYWVSLCLMVVTPGPMEW